MIELRVCVRAGLIDSDAAGARNRRDSLLQLSMEARDTVKAVRTLLDAEREYSVIHASLLTPLRVSLFPLALCVLCFCMFSLDFD